MSEQTQTRNALPATTKVAGQDLPTIASNPNVIQTWLKTYKPTIESVMPPGFNFDRTMNYIIKAASRNPQLLKCTGVSFTRAMREAYAMGLEPDSPFQHGATIPYWNKKTGTLEAEFQVMFRGLILIAS